MEGCQAQEDDNKKYKNNIIKGVEDLWIIRYNLCMLHSKERAWSHMVHEDSFSGRTLYNKVVSPQVLIHFHS